MRARAAGAWREDAPREIDNGTRTLVLAPTSNDARLTARFLEKAGLPAKVCADVTELAAQIQEGCGALLLAEESLAVGRVGELVSLLEDQPSWSDLPVILITGPGETGRARPRFLATTRIAGNIAIVERPVRPETLISTCVAALRSRRRQYQVRDLVEQLRDGDRKKDEFLAMLAHELRNPLAAVANAAALLRSPDAEDRDWAAGVIRRQSGQLARLIDDLLDVSRITTGKIRLKKEVVDVATIMDRARDSVQTLVTERKHALSCSYPTGILWIEADPTRAEQIVLNLLTNAAKYTPAGGQIELSAVQQGKEVRITVRDNGMGIAPQRLPEMFQLFAQGERSVARSEGGLGVGLTIVQRLVEMHGGRIDAHSEGLNRGSTFTACFPAVPRSPWAPSSADQADPTHLRKRVLIVDDNVDTAEAMARLLGRAGHDTSVVHNGTDALQRARLEAPDAVIMDIGLPEMDGYEVARRMRGEDWRQGGVIIAVTGYGQAEDRRQAIEAGFDHHLTKPVDMEQLKALLDLPLRSAP